MKLSCRLEKEFVIKLVCFYNYFISIFYFSIFYFYKFFNYFIYFYNYLFI